MSVRRIVILTVGILVVAVAISATTSESISRVVVVAVINIILVVAYHVFSGTSGVLSFGHMSFATIGGYAAGLLVMPVALKTSLMPELPGFLQSAQIAPIVAVLLAGMAAAVFAGVTAAPLARISGLAAGLASAALLLVVRDIAANWDTVTRGQRGLSPLPTSTTLTSALVWLLLTVLVAVLYENSSWGLRLRATRSDVVAAAAAGIGFRVERAKALVLSGFLTGVGGALLVLLLGSITPDVFFLDYTFLIIAMAVVGGYGSLEGALIGAASVSVVSEILRQIEQGAVFGFTARPGVARAGLGLILLVVLLYRPSGLVSLGKRNGRLHPGSSAVEDARSDRNPTTTPERNKGVAYANSRE